MLSPLISNVETTPGAFAADGTAVPVTSTLTLSDPNSTTLTGATVSLGSTDETSEDLLAFTNTSKITGNFNSSTGTLTLTGTDSVADYQAALRSVTYQDTSADPTPNIRRFTIDVSDGAGTSQNAYRYINITPLISNVETTTASYAAGSGATHVTNALTLGATPTGTITGATVKIDANYVNGQDVLAFTNASNITGSFDASTGTLTLTGTDSVSHYQAALRSVTYANTSNYPTTGIRRFAITVDGATNSNFVADRYFNIGSGRTISNVETTPGTFAAGGMSVPVTSTLTLSDPNSTTLTGATVSLGSTDEPSEDVLAFANNSNITGNFNSLTGTLTLTGTDTVADYQAALRSITYQDISADPTPNIRRFTIDVSDGADTSESEYRYINVTPLISNVETTTAFYEAGSGATPVTNGLTLGATPSGNITGATVKIDANYVNGQDVLAFTNTSKITGNFDASTGTLTLTGTDSVANYQAALRSVTYSNTSSDPTTGIRRFAITVNGATNSNFVVDRYFDIASGLTISNVETTPGTFAAGGTAVPVTSTLSLTDLSNTTLTGATVSLGPTDQPSEDVLAFSNNSNITGNFNSSTGTLTLMGTASLADYQAALRSITYQDTSADPTPNIRRFTIDVSDGNGPSENEYRYINIIPLISHVETATANYAAGSGVMAVTNGLTLGATPSGDITGATVKIDANYVNDQDVLAFMNKSNITGSFDASTGTLTLTGTDSVANYQAALRSVTYANTSINPTMGIRRFAITVNGATNSNFVVDRYFDIT